MLDGVRHLQGLLLGLVGVVGAVGCRPYAHHSEVYEEISYGSSESELVLRGVEQSGRASKGLSLASPLHSGDKTAFRLSLPEPLYVYVVNFAPDGSKNIIWPSHEPRLVSGHQRIPEDGGWFTLSGQTGQEVVAIVATRDEQSLRGAGARRVLSLVERAASSDLTRVQSALPPGLTESGYATMGIRGHGLTLSGKTMRVRSDDPIVMILDVDHRP